MITAMICHLVLAVIGFPLALATLLQDEENMACDSKDCPERKSLLQGTLPRSTKLAHRGAPQGSMLLPPRPKLEAPQRSMMLPQRAREACPLDISGVADAPGNAEPLTEAGFENVRACCCPAQMREFIRRLVQIDTNVVCHEGGLGGLTLFYYCSSDYPGNDFDKLVASIGSDSDAQNGACPWIGFGTDKNFCPPMDPTACNSFPGVTEPPCSDCEPSTTTTTTTTTAPEVISLQVKFDNIDYDLFVNDTGLRNALTQKVKNLVDSKFPCPPCRPLTQQDLIDHLNLGFFKGSLIVNVSTALVAQICTGSDVISAYTDWAVDTLVEDMRTAVNEVPDIGKAVTGGNNDVTVNTGVNIEKITTFVVEPCPHDFPWCNKGDYCEKAWCRYYGGCKSSSYRISRSCSSQYVPRCTVPSRAGYDFNLVGGTTTISGFNPSGVTCAAGYVGKVTYTVCSSAETPYSVSGCQAISTIQYTQQCSNCYCADVSGHSVRVLLGAEVSLLKCKQACNDDPDCGFITYYDSQDTHFNCYTCPLSGWTQAVSNTGGDIHSKVLNTNDWYGAAR